MTAALVIVGMSVREVDARDRLNALATSYNATVAYLQLGDPSLSRELTRLADEGVDQIDLVAVSLGSLAPSHAWVRRIAAHWWRTRTGHKPDVLVATKLLTQIDARSLAEVGSEGRPITGTEPGLTSRAWEDVTRHRHQVLICRGPRCTAMGSDTSAEALILATMKHGLTDDDVLITHTGCQFPCNNAPVVQVQPADVWYANVDSMAAEQIVEHHLVHGWPLASHRLQRGT